MYNTHAGSGTVNEQNTEKRAKADGKAGANRCLLDVPGQMLS